MRFEVLRSYMSVDVYHVEAESEAEAIRKAKEGEGHVKTYDGDYDADISVEPLEALAEIEKEGAA